MNELALFAGAGGGLLASRILGWRTVCAVEYDGNRRAILMARQDDGHLESFPIWDDIRTFDGLPWRGRVDVVSGGFPCQAYSTAARGKNVADDLWPEMRRVVAEVAPRHVFAENVARRAIDAAADDLEAMGYETRCIALSASDLGGDHIRPRYWLAAHADRDGEFCRTVNAEMEVLSGVCPRVWETYAGRFRVPDGVAGRMDRLSAIGDGQVAIVAAAAWRLMTTVGDTLMLSEKQKELKAKHGTPLEFAKAVNAAIGDISPREADEAIYRYLVEWNDAGIVTNQEQSNG